MNPRRTSLRAALDQLTQDFAEAVLRAVRRGSPTELAAIVESVGAAGARSRVRRPAPAAPSAPARTQGPSRPRPTSAPRPAPEPAPAAKEIAAHVDPVAAPAADSSRTEAVPTTTAAPPLDRCWTVNVSGANQQEMALEEIVGAHRAGIVTDETLVWRDGMAEWRAIRDVPELAGVAAQKRSSKKP